jgi:predicted amidohydrolase YtcJ
MKAHFILATNWHPSSPALTNRVLEFGREPTTWAMSGHGEVPVQTDLVLTNGRIYTVDERNPVADAMAVRGSHILAVGRASDVESLAGPGTKRVNLRGRTVIPGLIDSHLHLLSFGLTLSEVSLQAAASVEEAVDLVRDAAGRTEPGDWIRGTGWDRNLFGRLPTSSVLDSVAPETPVILASKDLHSLWVNSKALRMAGIGPQTADPADGEIVRDPITGEPSGVLKEGARAPIFAAVPKPSAQQRRTALSEALRIAAASGLTGLQTFEDVDTFETLQSLNLLGQLRLRVCCHLWKDALDHAIAIGVRSGFGDEWLRLGHLKLFLDGALGSQTALMMAPYAGSNSRGIQSLTQDEFRGIVLRAARSGIGTAVHAIGDAANRIALDVYEETAATWRSCGVRQRIEHVQLLAPGDERRLGKLGVVASMQPSHATSDWQVADRHWAGRTSQAYAWRSILQSGAPLAFGSDCPVEPIAPLPGLYAAVTRMTAEGLPEGGWHPEQRLTPVEALRAYTLGSAFAGGQESITGSLEAGKLADFVVLSRDPFNGPPELFLAVGVEATVVGGAVVHGDLSI